MTTTAPVLVVGATGMIGRPVVRRLVGEGFAVRAMVRDEARARRVLPDGVTLVRGDLREPASVAAALDGASAVYLNLAVPMVRRPPDWDPERDGTNVVVSAARSAGVGRLVRISALGVDQAAGAWWAARHKLEADLAVMESGIAYTIFRPTWFMESIPLFRLGPLPALMCTRLGDARLRWIAGDDFARHVAAALRLDAGAGSQVVVSQGPELLSMREAMRRFVRAWPSRLWIVPAWRPALRAAGALAGPAHYLDKLLEMTVNQFAPLDREPIANEHAEVLPLPEPTMTIEDYVRYVRETGDLPRK